jgi:outer membrane protein assembly factor BamB
LALLALAAGAAGGNAEDDPGFGPWPQWRGPTRDGRAPEPSWPADLAPETLREVWRVEELGPSYSGPVADASRVYTTETVDGKHEVVRAFRRDTGEELWRVSWEGSMRVPFFAARNGSWIRSTPAVDDGALFVLGMRDVLHCLDAATGERRWSVDFPERFSTGVPPFGGVPSPLLTENHVFVQAGNAIVKLDRQTGATVWRSMVAAKGIMSAGAFSSPVLATLHGEPQLVVQSRTELAGLDPEDGSIRWSIPVRAFRGMNILTPTVFGDGVFTSAYGGRAQLLVIEEPQEEGGGMAVRSAWDTAAQGYMTSPVVVEGHAYLFLRSERFGCLDLATGRKRWSSPPTGGDAYWSLAVQGDRILALSNRGMLRLVQADPTAYRVLAERQVTKSETWAHVAPAGSQLFVRARDELLAFSWQ